MPGDKHDKSIRRSEDNLPPPPPRGRDRSSSGTGEHRRSSGDRPSSIRPPTSTPHRFQFADQRDHDRPRTVSPRRSSARGVSENENNTHQSFRWQKTTPKRSKSTDGHAHALPASSEYKHRGSPSQPSGSRKRHRTPSPGRPARPNPSRKGKERMRSPSPADSVIDVSSDKESQVATESEDDDPPPRRVS
jgi:hypothetical protein